MLLNALDLTTSVTGVIHLSLLVVYWKIPAPLHDILTSLYFINLEARGFATCLLITAHSIRLWAPFYSVRGRAVFYAAIIFTGYTVIREVKVTLVKVQDRTSFFEEGLYNIHMGILLSEIGLMLIATLAATILSSLKILIKPDTVKSPRWRKVQATITMAILAGVFYIFNVFYLFAQVLYFFYQVKLRESIVGIVLYFGIFYAVPLNSAVNPLIYLSRKRKMRRYLRNPTKEPKPRNPMLAIPHPPLKTCIEFRLYGREPRKYCY